MGKYEARAILVDFVIITSIPAYSAILRDSPDIYMHVQIPVKPWHIKNQKDIHNLGLFITLSNIYNYAFPKNSRNQHHLFKFSLLYEIGIINVLNTALIFPPEEFILCKKM